jgi:hypothetical protein
MANSSIFQDPTKALPKSDEQIVRVGMKEQEIGGRTSHIPTNIKSGQMGISHVPNAGSKH